MELVSTWEGNNMTVQLNDIAKCLQKEWTISYRLFENSKKTSLIFSGICMTYSTPMGTNFNDKFNFFSYYSVEGIDGMKSVSFEQQEAQKIALKKSVMDLGGIDNFADELDVSPYTIKNIIYDPIKYGTLSCALLAMIKAGADINVVSPGTPKLNPLLEQAFSKDIQSIYLKEIILNPNIHYLNYCHDKNEFILVDEKFEVISGAQKWRELESNGILRTAVKVVDLDALWHNKVDFNKLALFVINNIRKWEIGIKLIERYGKGAGFRSDYEEKNKKNEKNCSKNSQPTSNLTEVENKKRRLSVKEAAAQIVEVGYGTFISLDKICLSEIYPLIKAVAQGLSVKRAMDALNAFFQPDHNKCKEMLHGLLNGEIDNQLLREIKELAKQQDKKIINLKVQGAS